MYGRAQATQKRRKQRARGLSRYKRSETFRLLKGAADAGFPVRGLEVDPVTGVLRVLFGKPEDPEGGDLLGKL